MSNNYIFEGKTTNEAIELGLKTLKVSKNDVEIKIIENEDKRSFFSILAPRIVKVEMILKENENKKVEHKEEKKKTDIGILKIGMEKVEKFLKEFKKNLPSEEISYIIKIEDNYVYVEILGEDLNYLIGYRGEVLNSIQSLLTTIASKNVEDKVRVIVNIAGYREKRTKVLEELAEKLAKTVMRTGKSVTLEPMTSYERKIIHSKLQNHNKVETTSIGEEPYRKVVISLK